MFDIILIYIFCLNKTSSSKVKCLESLRRKLKVFVDRVHYQKLKHTSFVIVLLTHKFLLIHTKTFLKELYYSLYK